MGRKRKSEVPAPTSMDAPLHQRMTAERWREKAESYVAKMGVIQRLRDDLKAEIKTRREEIDSLMDEAENLRLELVEGIEGRKQGDLFAGEARTKDPTPAEADQALDEVAKRVEAAEKNGAPAGKPGNGFDFTDEPPPRIDPAKAGPTRIEASRLASDDAGDGDEADEGEGEPAEVTP